MLKSLFTRLKWVMRSEDGFFWLPLIGAGMGLLSGLMNRKPQTQTTTDPSLQAYLDKIRGLGLNQYNAMGGGPGQGYDTSMQALQGLSGAGTEASNILMGKDPQGLTAAMNPFMSAMQPVFDRMRQAAATQARLGATSQFGYGSADAEAAQRAMLGVGDTEAQFNYQGFNDLMSRMMGVNQLGYSADMGLQAGSMLPMQYQLARMGLLQPGMQSATQRTTTPTQFDPFQAMLGGALAGAGAGGFGRGFSSAGSYTDPNQAVNAVGNAGS
jgi:hypothetical protein